MIEELSPTPKPKPSKSHLRDKLKLLNKKLRGHEQDLRWAEIEVISCRAEVAKTRNRIDEVRREMER